MFFLFANSSIVYEEDKMALFPAMVSNILLIFKLMRFIRQTNRILVKYKLEALGVRRNHSMDKTNSSLKFMHKKEAL